MLRSTTAKAAFKPLAPAEDAALFERAVADGSILRLSPAAEARRLDYLAGRTGQRLRALMPRLVATDEAGVRALMAEEVESGRAKLRLVQLNDPPQTMTVWELHDGSVVRLKPMGDDRRIGPTLSGEIKLDARAPDADQSGIAFKVDGQSRPVPKNRYDLGFRSEDSEQAREVEQMTTNAAHIEIEK